MLQSMRLPVLGALIATLVATPAQAFVPDREPPEVVVGRATRGVRSIEPAVDAPAGWRGIRDRDTGVVLQLWGGYIEVPGAMRDPAIAERAARAFVAHHAALLAPGARIDELRVVSNRVDGTLRTVGFQQMWRGLRVVGGQLHVVFQRDRLFVAGSQALPGVQLTVPHTRTVVTTRAAAWLRNDLGTTATVRDTGERVVLPLVYGRGDIAYRVADLLDARAGLGRWDVYVAPDGAPLLRRNRVHAATGTLEYNVGIRYPLDARVDLGASRANITADGTPTTTADDGSFAWTGNAAATVVPGLIGAFVMVINDAGALATASLTASPDQPVVWSLATDEVGDAQLSAYVYATLAKARARRIDPTLAWLDQTLEVHVNANATCNAFSTGDAIYFFRRDATCENTARLADVVLHEFGHSFHAQSIIPGAGALDASIVEGIADFFAANIVDDSGIGRGFDFTNEPRREHDPPGIERRYPDDVTGSPHTTGLIIGGTLWDLREVLIAQLGTAPGIAATERIFLGILQRAADLPSTYVAALVADDDDGSLGNGTPHGCAIYDAFGRHGLVSGYSETRVLPPTIDGTTVTAAVEVRTGACPSPNVTAMTLAWFGAKTTHGEVAMTSLGNVWSAAFPVQPDGTVLRYKITATLDDGNVVRLPDNAADPLYDVFIGPSTPIWCEHFDTNPNWMQSGVMEWDVARPIAPGAGDPPSGFAGDNVLGTDVRGDGRYRDKIETRIDTPPIDATGYAAVHLQFRRWLTIEDATFDEARVLVNGTPLWSNARSQARTLDHLDREWRFVDLDVSALAAAEPLVIGWSLRSNPVRSFGGWNLDEICVVGIEIPQCTSNCDEPEAGCCSTGGDPTGSLALGVGVALWIARRRRQR